MWHPNIFKYSFGKLGGIQIYLDICTVNYVASKYIWIFIFVPLLEFEYIWIFICQISSIQIYLNIDSVNIYIYIYSCI